MNELQPQERRTAVPAPELSVIVLCYRAGESILLVIDPLYKQLASIGVDFELVLVANYWPEQHDPTPVFATQFAASRPEVRVIAREKEGAMGWDMRCGFEAATGHFLVVMDGDAQNPVDDAVRMHQRMKESGADVMKGCRVLRHDGLYRRVVSIGYNALFRLLFRTVGLWDINGKPKALTRNAYERMRLKSDDWFIDAEIVLAARELGLRIEEMPVEFLPNPERASFVRPSAIWEFLANMARYRRRRPNR
ncbi:MAG: glycosyltransferase family 2 protein [Actinobacteria bacterium]|nr:glycosyltransferase family 2 protein [Actinomycetota bacterium]